MQTKLVKETNMIIYRNKHIPVQGFKAFFFCGILFVKGNAKIDDVTMNHESVHSRQWTECGVVALIVLSPLILTGLWWLWIVLSVFAFYMLYGIEWLVKLFIYKTLTKRIVAFHLKERHTVMKKTLAI